MPGAGGAGRGGSSAPRAPAVPAMSRSPRVGLPAAARGAAGPPGALTLTPGLAPAPRARRVLAERRGGEGLRKGADRGRAGDVAAGLASDTVGDGDEGHARVVAGEPAILVAFAHEPDV